MADIGRIYDSMGRLIGETENVRDILRSMLQRDVGKAQAYNPKSESSSNAQKELEKQVEKLSKIIQETNDNAKDYAEKIIEASKVIEEASKNKPKSESAFVDPSKIYDAIASGMEKGLSNEKSQVAVAQESAAKSANPDGRGFSRMERGIGELVKHATKKGSLYVSDAEVQKLLEDIKDSLASGGGGGGIGGGGGAGGGGAGGGFDSEDFNRKLELEWGDTLDFDPVTIAAEQNAAEVSQIYRNAIAGSIMNSISGMLDQLNPIQDAFGNAIFGEMSYQQEMKKVAFQTQGITQEAGNMQAAFFQTGKVVAKTGYDLSVFQKNYTQAIKKGLKPQKESLNITTSALNTAKMIGGNADGLADTFVDWNQQLGLSDNQLADVGRGIRDVAKFSGITGENLEQAVKSSEQFMKNMKSAGTLTATASKNIMTMSAFAQKLGVADEMQGLMNGLTSSSNLLLNASQETKNMLYLAAGSVGRINDLQQGTLMNTKAGIKDLAQGMENTFKQITGYSSDQIDQMTAEEKMRINVQLESALGVGLEDFRRQIEVVGEAGKSYTERLATIDKQLEANLTLEERRALELQKQNMALSAGLEMSTKLADAAKGVDNVSEAVDKIRKNAGAGFGDIQNELVEMTKEMGMGDLASQVSSGDNEAIAKAMALSATTKLADAGGTDFSSEMLAAIKANDMSEIRELQEKMTAEQQKMGIDQEANTDPISNMAKTMQEINETIRGFTGPALHTLMGILGAIGVLPLMIGGAIVAAFLGAGGIVASIVGGLGGIIGPLLGLGGTAAAAGGAATAVGGAVSAIGGGLASAAAAVGPALSAAAAALPAIGLGIAALTAAVVLIGAAINYTIGTEELEKITGAAVALVKGVAAFAWEMLKIGASITALGLLASLGPAMAPLMIMGGQALAVLVPGVVALALGMMALGAAVEYVVGADKSVKLIENVAAFIDATSGVVWSIMKFSALTAVLGFLAILSPGISAAMKAGAVALLILTPATFMFSLAMMGLGKALEYVVGADESVKLIENVAAFIDAGSGVVWSIMKFSALTALLGGLLILSPIVAGGLVLGAAALAVLTPATLVFSTAMMGLGKALEFVVGADESVKLIENVAAFIDAASGVVWSIMKFSALTALLGGLLLLSPIVAASLILGAAALTVLTPGIIAFSAAIYAIGKGIDAIAGLDTVVSTVEKMSALIDATSSFAWSITKFAGIATLLGALALSSIFVAPFLFAGAVGLAILTPGVLAFTGAIVAIGSALGGTGGLDETISIVEKMNALVAATSSFAWSIIKFTGLVALLGAMAVFSPILSIALFAGSVALGVLTAGFVAFTASVLGIGLMIESIMSIDEAISITEKLGELVGAIQSFAFKLMKYSAVVAALGALVIFAPILGAALLAGTAALLTMLAGFVAFSSLTVLYGKSFDAIGGIDEAVHIADQMGAFAEAITSFAVSVMKFSALAALLGGLTLAAGLVGGILVGTGTAALMGLSTGLVSFGLVLKSFADKMGSTSDVEDTANKIVAVAKMFSVVPEVMNVLINSIVPMVSRRMFGLMAAPADALNGTAIKKFSDFFLSVSKMVRDGVITPVNKYLPDSGEVKSVSESIVGISKIIGLIPGMMDNMINNIIPMVEDNSWWPWSKAPSEVLTGDVMKKFKDFFLSVSKFLRYGIMEPVRRYFPDAGEVQEAASIINSLASMVSAVPGVINNVVDGLIPLVADDSWWPWSQTPQEIFEGNKEKFKEFFLATSQFLRHGIMEPVRRYFPDAGEVKETASVINSLASMVSAVPSVINNVVDGLIPLVADNSWWPWSQTPQEIFEGNKEKFKEFFLSVSKFLRYGIMEPVMRYFPGTGEVKTALELIKGMASIVEAIPPFLARVGNAIGNLVDNTGWFGLGPSPMQTITEKVGIFSNYFQAIAVALNEGIVSPIKLYFPSPKVIKKSLLKILSMAALVEAIPPFLIRINDAIGELVDGFWWTLWSSNPMSIITKKVKLFSGYFKAISIALAEGIVYPIQAYWPNPKEIKKVGQQLKGMTKVVNGVPPLLKELNDVLEEYVGGSWWGSKVADMADDSKYFGEYFAGIAKSLKEGFIKPIQKWPNSNLIQEVGKQIEEVRGVLIGIPNLLESLTDSMKKIENGEWWNIEFENEGEKYKKFFKNTGSFIKESLIDPLSDLPDSASIQEAITRIELICEVFGKYADAMSCMAEASKNLSSTEPIDLAGIENVGDAIKKAQPAIEKMSEGAQVKKTTLFPEDYRDPASLSQEELMMQQTGAQVKKITIPGTDESNEDLLKRLTTVDPSKDPTLVSDKFHKGLEDGIKKLDSGPKPTPAIMSQRQQMLVNETGMSNEDQLEAFGYAPTGKKFEQSAGMRARNAMYLEEDAAMRAAADAAAAAANQQAVQPEVKKENQWTAKSKIDWEAMYAHCDKIDPTKGEGWENCMSPLRKAVDAGKPWEEIKKLMQLPDREIGAAAKGGDFLTTGAQLLLVGEKGAERVTIKPADQVANLEKKAFEYSEMASEEAASVLNVPSAVRMEPTQAQPKPLSDVHERVRQQYATEDEGGKNQSKDMADIANASNNQVSLLERILASNDKLVDLLTPSGNRVGETDPMGSPSTRSNKKPISSPQYGSWQYGKMGQNASKQLLTPGE